MVATNVIEVGSMPRRKQIYKITYPNGKIYVGMDLIGLLLNVGSPSAREQIAADLDAHRLDLTLRKEILWESETATDDEVRAISAAASHPAHAPSPGSDHPAATSPRSVPAVRHQTPPNPHPSQPPPAHHHHRAAVMRLLVELKTTCEGLKNFVSEMPRRYDGHHRAAVKRY